jgi:hypothetical protein
MIVVEEEMAINKPGGDQSILVSPNSNIDD